MVTREELHQLVESLPMEAMETAQQMLTKFQLWPPPRRPMPPEFEQFRAAVKDRYEKAPESERGIFRTTGRGGFGPWHGGGGNMGSAFWEDETMVTETLRLHKGHQLLVTVRIRLDSSGTLVYAHSVKGPGDKLDQHEIRFNIPNSV